VVVERGSCGQMIRKAAACLSLVLSFLSLGSSRANAQEVLEYYGVDAVGSIRVVFAADGSVKARSDYLPFGEEFGVTTPGGPLPSQRFTGQQRDAEEGHDNFNARTYLTRAGRMTSPDPVLAGLFEPQRWNQYAYALNNPLSYGDPTGMEMLRYFDYAETGGGMVGNGPSSTMNSLLISLVYGPTGHEGRGSQGGGGAGRRGPRMGMDDKGNVTREEEVTVTPEKTDEGTHLDGSEIPACENCLPYTGEPDKFSENNDFWTTFLNSGPFSLGGIFKAGGSFMGRGAMSKILSISPQLAQKGWSKHGAALGLSGNWFPARAKEFRSAVNQFINKPSVKEIVGRYHDRDVIHYFNTRTGVNLMSDRQGNYISVFKLDARQQKDLLTKGWVW
jgi:RHS repeat-associated protein